ncbi:MAG TPA: hypothetical protein VEK39_08510 [Solirubrobacterales bacterium]|nr:hypothetical protein [Solirubrobacterales bacterium]
MRRGLALILACVLLIVAAGCGDGGDGETTTTASLTKAQFVRKANKICKASDDKIEQASKRFYAGAPPGQEAPPNEIEQFGEQTVYPTIQDEIDRIRSLGPPEGDEGQVKAILQASEAGLAKLKQDPKQLAKGGAAPAFEKAQELAGDYGLDQCASG